MESLQEPSVVGRFAPSPTGGLHLGSALAALAAWASVRSRGGRFVLRVEDLDGPRVVPGATRQQIEDLKWLGLDWDEGPNPSKPTRDLGPHGPYRQSERAPLYEQALKRLAEAGRLFPCRRSRKDLRELASAPHGGGGLPPYPVRFRPASLPPDWYDAFEHGQPDSLPRDVGAALRFTVPDETVRFRDRVRGAVEENVRTTTGDFVLKRRDGVYAYQLAVVVDDRAMGVTEVARGADLFDSTARQILLHRALGGPAPAFAHVPLAVGADGEKLSKRDGALEIAALREGGVAPKAIIGLLAEALGQAEDSGPLAPAEVAARWAWGRVPSEPWRVPDDVASRLRVLSS